MLLKDVALYIFILKQFTTLKLLQLMLHLYERLHINFKSGNLKAYVQHVIKYLELHNSVFLNSQWKLTCSQTCLLNI